MKNLLFYLLAKYVFPSIKYVFSSISNKRMSKYVLPSILFFFSLLVYSGILIKHIDQIKYICAPCNIKGG